MIRAVRWTDGFSAQIRRASRIRSWSSVGGRPTFLPSALARSQAGPDALAGGVRLVSAPGQHHTAIELCAAAAVPGVDIFPDGDDPDLSLGKIRLDGHPFVEVPAEPILSDDDGVAGMDALHELLPARPFSFG